jgi:hypothetical protein
LVIFPVTLPTLGSPLLSESFSAHVFLFFIQERMITWLSVSPIATMQLIGT